MTTSSQDTAGEGVAEVIAFPRSGTAPVTESDTAAPQDTRDAEPPEQDLLGAQPESSEPVRPWPGQVIDLQQARAMAGLSSEDATAASGLEPQGSVERASVERASVERASIAGASDNNAPDEPSDDSALATARQIALRSLAARGRSEAELRQKLADRGVERWAIDEVIAGLKDKRLIDDAQLAEDLAQGLSESKKMGPVGIKQALVKRRIPRGIIDQVVSGLDDVSDDTLEELARSRMRVLRGLDRQVQVRRLVGFLARRGYQGPEVYRVVGMVVDEPEGGPDVEPDIQPHRGVRFSPSTDSESAWVTPLGRR
jgi:SOS response regulatory protein OraA/RecX